MNSVLWYSKRIYTICVFVVVRCVAFNCLSCYSWHKARESFMCVSNGYEFFFIYIIIFLAFSNHCALIRLLRAIYLLSAHILRPLWRRISWFHTLYSSRLYTIHKNELEISFQKYIDVLSPCNTLQLTKLWLIMCVRYNSSTDVQYQFLVLVLFLVGSFYLWHNTKSSFSHHKME